MDTIFVLTLLVAIISVVTNIYFGRKQNNNKEFVYYDFNEPFDIIKIKIINAGAHPLSLCSYSIGIGAMKDNQDIIMKGEHKRKIGVSDESNLIFKRDEIQNHYNKLGLNQDYYRRLWINLIFTTKNITRVIHINPEIIKSDYYGIAEQYIATDIFLGLPQMKSITPTSSRLTPTGMSTRPKMHEKSKISKGILW